MHREKTQASRHLGGGLWLACVRFNVRLYGLTADALGRAGCQGLLRASKSNVQEGSSQCRHEIVGIVTEVGSKAGSHFKIGDRAGIGCFVRACQVRYHPSVSCPTLYRVSSEDSTGISPPGTSWSSVRQGSGFLPFLDCTWSIRSSAVCNELLMMFQIMRLPPGFIMKRCREG